MGRRNDTPVQALLPEIKATLAEGRAQGEAAEHFGCKDKYVVKGALKREGKRQRRVRESREKMPGQERWLPARHMRLRGYE